MGSNVESSLSTSSQLRDVPLSSLADVNPSRSDKKAGRDEAVSFIPMADVTDTGRWIGDQSRKYGEVCQGFVFFEEGDVLFAKITPCMENGKGCHAIGLENAKGFGSTEFHVLRAREGTDAGYIYQWSTHQELRRQARNAMTGSAGQQRVPKEFFDNFLVPLFSKSEQGKIAEILSTVDRAIEQTEALIAKQQRIKTGLMQDLLTRGIDEHGNLRSEQTHKFKDSPLGMIPAEWNVVGIDEIAKITTGGKDTQDRDDAGMYPFFVRSQTIEKINSFSFDGEGVLTAGDGVGVGKVFHYYKGKFDFHQRVYCIHSFANGMDGYFFFHYFRLNFMSRVSQFSAKGSVDSVRMAMIAKMLIPKPSQGEQVQSVEMLRKADVLEAYFTEALSKLRSLKTALMQDLLTGKKRVTTLINDMEVTIV